MAIAANNCPALETIRMVDWRHDDDDDDDELPPLLVVVVLAAAAAVVGTVSVAMGPPCGHPATCVTELVCTHWRRSRAVMGVGPDPPILLLLLLVLGYRANPWYHQALLVLLLPDEASAGLQRTLE